MDDLLQLLEKVADRTNGEPTNGDHPGHGDDETLRKGGRGDFGDRDGLNRFKKLVADCADNLIGTTRGGNVPEPPSPEEISTLLIQANAGLDDIKVLVPAFHQSPKSLYNKAIASEFSRRFLIWLENNPRENYSVPDELKNSVEVCEAFNGHVFNCVRRRWKKQSKNFSEEDFAKLNADNARAARRQQLYRCREAACLKDPNMRKHVKTLKKVGANGMSSDEDDGADVISGYARRYHIIDKSWRGSRLKNFLRHLDLVHSKSRGTNGGPIRERRLHPNQKVNNTRNVPFNLPRDCYSSRYFESLNGLEKRLLGATAAEFTEF